MSIKCGGSDATSGMASNCVIGYVADKLVDLGATAVSYTHLDVYKRQVLYIILTEAVSL